MNRRQMFAVGALAATALPLVAGMARAQDSAMMADGTIDPTKAPAILNGTYSRLASEIAVERAESEAVRGFAALEVAEQAAVAQAFGVPADAPAAIPEGKAPMLERLRAASGAEFDRLYVEDQIMGHEELRPIHEAYAADGADPMARGASIVGVTGIDSHLAMLDAIRASLG